MGIKNQPYADNGVFVSNSAVKVGDSISLSYEGLLAKSGADMIFAYVGYGEAWEDSNYIPMETDGGMFKVSFKVSKPGSLNVAFKDSANNWDNNSTENYIFKVAKKAENAEKEKVVKTVKAVKKTEEKKESTTKTAVKKSVAAKSAPKAEAAKKTADKPKRTVKKKES